MPRPLALKRQWMPVIRSAWVMDEVTVVEGPPYSVVSDKAKKENFQPLTEKGR